MHAAAGQYTAILSVVTVRTRAVRALEFDALLNAC
jgi:hypothetical protein